MKFAKYLTAFSVVSVFAGVALPANAITNLGFETGDFTGWNTIGDTSVEDNTFGTGPDSGNFQGFLSTTGSASDTDIENFLGLSNGSLDTLIGGNATEGSAISQTFSVPSGGTTLSFSTNFLTDESTPSGFNDFAFFSVNGSPTLLADTNSSFVNSGSAFDEETGFFNTTVSLPAGSNTLGFGVLDEGDTVVTSGLLVDSANTQPVPFEAEGSMGLVALGGFIWYRRHKKRNQAMSQESKPSC